jgi:hypothetical protein
MNRRKLTSLTLAVSLVLTVWTSIVLYIMPHGRVAYWSDWKMWGLDKPQWSALHINLGLLFIISGALHCWYNWKAITTYMKKARNSRLFSHEALAAMAIALLFTVGTYLELPPWNTVITLEERIKAMGAEKYGEPPYGHAELSSLKMFCKKTGININVAVENIKKRKLHFTGPNQTVAQIAATNNMTPKELYKIIRPVEAETEKTLFPESPMPGFGRQRLADLCEKYGLDMEDVAEKLAAQGIQATGNMTVREMADSAGISPFQFFETMRKIALAEQN